MVIDASRAGTASSQPQEVTPTATANEEYVAVDLADREPVDGKLLMIVAYCIILGILLAYAFSLLRREQTVNKDIADLLERLKNHPTDLE
jgi:hypothetical protein